MNPPHKGQWRTALIFPFICAWINGWVNNREAGDLRRHRTHYDVIVMWVNNDSPYLVIKYTMKIESVTTTSVEQEHTRVNLKQYLRRENKVRIIEDQLGQPMVDRWKTCMHLLVIAFTVNMLTEPTTFFMTYTRVSKLRMPTHNPIHNFSLIKTRIISSESLFNAQKSILTKLQWKYAMSPDVTMTSSNGNIFSVTSPLCGYFTGHQWIPLTKASDAELWCVLWSAPEQTVE